jgi:hypothetical protein
VYFGITYAQRRDGCLAGESCHQFLDLYRIVSYRIVAEHIHEKRFQLGQTPGHLLLFKSAAIYARRSLATTSSKRSYTPEYADSRN